ncbi:MAG: FliH/SctL family protein [Actinomycetota bacterium]|nr:FliH/SctL family protein [Actinomycetota bacterium]
MTAPARVITGRVDLSRRRLERFGPAVSEAERREVLDRAREQGRREGLEQAAAEIAASRRRVDEAAEVLGRVAEALEAARESAAEVAGEAVLGLAVELAETVIGRHLELAASPGADALRRALASVAPGSRVTAHLAPADLESLGDDRVHEGSALRVELVADPSLERGDCMVDCGPSVVDARLAPALERVRDLLRSGR